MRAFTDEYGDVSLAVENAGVTTFFIVTAVLVRDEFLRYNASGPMRSVRSSSASAK